jgi:hypothetical protein
MTLRDLLTFTFGTGIVRHLCDRGLSESGPESRSTRLSHRISSVILEWSRCWAGTSDA